jgi:hypothetical protein
LAIISQKNIPYSSANVFFKLGPVPQRLKADFFGSFTAGLKACSTLWVPDIRLPPRTFPRALLLTHGA